MRQVLHSDDAPAAIGTYSQAVRVGSLVFLSGQIPLDPQTMELVEGDVDEQVRQVLRNLRAVCRAAGAELDAIAKLNVFLLDMAHFPVVNEVMAEFFQAPYPARAAVGVAALPRGAVVEMEAVLALDEAG